MKLQDTYLSNIDRISRTALGFAMIGLAYFGTGYLGWLAVLPIIAIVPLMTATLGICPVEGYLRSTLRHDRRVVYQEPAAVGVRAHRVHLSHK